MNRLSFLVAILVAAGTCGTAFGQGSDDCATPQDVTGLATVAVDTTTATTTTPAIPGSAANCPGTAFGIMNQDVWFSWTAPDDGNLTLSTCGLVNFDTDIAIHTGTCAAPTQIACNGDGTGCAGFSSLLQDAQVQSGTTYLIQVGGWDATENGTGTMDITFSPGLLSPANLVCTVDPGTGVVTANFDLLDTYATLNVYIDGVLTATVPTPPAGANTYISPPLGGGIHQLCFEGADGAAVSAQTCCNVFLQTPCPAFDGEMIPITTYTPFVGCVSCNAAGLHADNSYFRAFDLINGYGVNDSIRVNCVTISIDASNTTTTQPVRVRLHYDLNGGNPNNIYSGGPYVQPPTAEMFYEEEFQVPAVADTLFNFVLGTGIVNPDALPGLLATADPGCLALQGAATTLVVEIFTPDGQTTNNGFFMAGTNAAQYTAGCTGPPVPPVPDCEIGQAYLYAPDCGLTAPVPTAAIGFPNDRYVIDVKFDELVPNACTGGGGVSNLNCNQNPGTTTATATWSSAGGAASWVVEVDGNVEATLPAATLTYTTLPLVAYTQSDIIITAYSGAGGTGSVVNFRSCGINVAPVNNWLQGALPITVGVTPFNITNAVTVQGPALDVAVCDFNIGADQQIWNDLYYCYTATTTGDVLVSTCSGNTFDTKLAIYAGNCLSNAPADVIMCNDDAQTGATTPGGTAAGSTNPLCTNFAAELTFAATAGTNYLIRLGTFNAAGLGAGELLINDCVPPASLDATYNCTSGDVTLTWATTTAWTGLTVERDNVLIATLPPTADTYVDLNVADGDHVYEVIASCGSGPNTSSINVSTLKYNGHTDIVFAMEGLQDNGDTGLIDGGPDVRDALITAGRNAGLIRASVADYPCVSNAAVQNLWILTGTVPQDYRITAAEGDQLGQLSVDGKNIHFEGSDHFGFLHVTSTFDARDGVSDATYNTGDGDDTFTSMDGLNGAGLSLSDLQNQIYAQDQAANDWTDQLTPATTDGAGTNAAAVWKIDDALAMGAYNTTIAYATNAGGKTISSSWELGGYGGDLDNLVSRYATFFGGAPPEVFRRGDTNTDLAINIADAIFTLGVLFPNQSPPPQHACRDSADANDDGTVNIADAIFILGNLFPGGNPPPGFPAPTGACGPDPTNDALDCANYPTPC